MSSSNSASGDRYVTFTGIDCAGNARQVVACIDRHMATPGHSTLFWEYFAKKRAGLNGPSADDLFLVHSNLNEIRELFETWEDTAALALLDKLEAECC